eukprot:scaffold7595_cov74-Skeletonema_dohrnii-CCMP3373.AAC.3
MQVDSNPNAYRAAVCVLLLCDRLIIGCESIHKITVESLRSQKNRRSVKSYEDYHEVNLKDKHVTQYQISGHELEGLLLSPRATETKTKNGHVACSSCYKAWCNNSDTASDTPPKHAISNGFAIGHIPMDIIENENITEQMSSLLARVRPFAYIFAYTAGAHKAIRGHFSFFEGKRSVMNHFMTTGANPLVYVVLCGRMTPTQREKETAKKKALLNMEKMVDLFEWFINESGHPAYEGVTPPTECPKPRFIVDEETPNNTDQEHDQELEKEFAVAGATFHFTSAHEPQDDTGIYESNQKFVKAMIDRTMPTLLVSGGKYADMRELQLEDVCPLQFPWGQGGPKVKRRTHISVLECYRHYCRLWLPQSFRGDFLLILNHMYNRQRCSYQTAVVTCKSSVFGQSLAEKMSKLKMKDLDQALFQKVPKQKVTGTAGEHIRAVEASSSECIKMGASHLRQKSLTPTQENANSGVGDTSDSTVMRKEWLDPAAIRYPFDFDEEGRPTEALKQQCIMTRRQKEKEIEPTNK